MGLNAGDLDRRIIIQEETITRNDWGGEEIAWNTLATVWAAINYDTGAEIVEADQRVSKNIITFTIRHRTDITARMRISYDSQYYTITFIEELERQIGLKLHCELRDHD